VIDPHLHNAEQSIMSKVLPALEPWLAYPIVNGKDPREMQGVVRYLRALIALREGPQTDAKRHHPLAGLKVRVIIDETLILASMKMIVLKTPKQSALALNLPAELANMAHYFPRGRGFYIGDADEPELFIWGPATPKGIAQVAEISTSPLKKIPTPGSTTERRLIHYEDRCASRSIVGEFPSASPVGPALLSSALSCPTGTSLVTVAQAAPVLGQLLSLPTTPQSWIAVSVFLVTSLSLVCFLGMLPWASPRSLPSRRSMSHCLTRKEFPIMTLVSLTDSCRLLVLDPKTLHCWLRLAHVSVQPHPLDARLKCVT
jgi:hypothetical protein